MLNRFIKERIERQREQSGKAQFPKGIELPLPVPPPEWERRRDYEEKKKEEPKRGVVIIDFL